MRNKATLETLHLDLRGQFCPATGFLAKLMPNFPLFSVLRHLSINILPLYLAGVADEEPVCSYGLLLDQLFPQSLVSLRLADNTSQPWVLAQLGRDIARLRESVSNGEFPLLRKIRIDTEPRLDDRTLPDTFASLGVDFRYCFWAHGHTRLYTEGGGHCRRRK